MQPEVRIEEDRILVSGVVETALGPLEKRVAVTADGVELTYGFSAWGERPPGSLRTGMVISPSRGRPECPIS